MSSSSSSPSSSTSTVSALFDQAASLATDSSSQVSLQATVLLLEDVTREVSSLGLFSLNEHISEVATAHIKFLRLPYLLAKLNNAIRPEKGEDVMQSRLQVLEVVQVYLEDFLGRCADYGIFEREHFEKLIHREDDFEVDRAQKIKMFAAKKELESGLSALKSKKESEMDDEQLRELHLKQLELDALEAQEEYRFVGQEKELLQHGMSLRKSDGNKEIEEETNSKPRPKFTPVVLTKDTVQKAVFGMGYKNVPIYTVQEFYEQRVRDGIWKPPSSSPVALQDLNLEEKAKEDEEREEVLEEKGDEEWLQRKRAMDDYKDEHRRGWGNRLNRA